MARENFDLLLCLLLFLHPALALIHPVVCLPEQIIIAFPSLLQRIAVCDLQFSGLFHIFPFLFLCLLQPAQKLL